MGILFDASGGALFLTVVPFAPTVILLPVVAISQMSVGYLIGICYMAEPKSLQGFLGLLFAAVSIIALATQTAAEIAGPVSQLNFFESARRPAFVAMNCLVILVIAAAYLSMGQSMLFMLLAAYADGLQFLTTRTLSTTLQLGTIWTPGMFCVMGLKVFFAVVNLHWQQLGLTRTLSQFAAAYPAAAAIMPVLLGTPFFGDHLELSRGLFLALASALLGLLLLSEPPKPPSP